jgi:hypothetical protein
MSDPYTDPQLWAGLHQGSSVLKRFYFDLVRQDTLIPDEIGVKATDLEEALEQAKIALAEMRESGEAVALGGGWEMLVRDKAGSVLRKLTL